jgi:hypothetical protein
MQQIRVEHGAAHKSRTCSPGTPSAQAPALFAVGFAAQTFPLLTSAGSTVVATSASLRRLLPLPPCYGLRLLNDCLIRSASRPQ